jgi:hypothetical protein
MKEMRDEFKILDGKPQGRNHLGDLGINSF